MSEQRPASTASLRVWPPRLYGRPDWIETYLLSVAKVLECQPEEVFADSRVRRATGELAAVIGRLASRDVSGDGGTP